MENTELEARVAKLEKQSASRFFVQYLLSPLLVLLVGYLINYRVEQNRGEIEKAKTDIQRIDLAQKMIPILFGGNPEEAFAAQRLMEKVVDPEVAKEFKDVVSKYYQAKVASDLKKGDVQSAVATITAAQDVGGQAADQVVQSVTQDQTKKEAIQTYTNRMQIASQKEREGFENLMAGKYDDAIKAFQAAEDAYHSYHQVYELARLLRAKAPDLNDDNKRKEVFQLIIDKYSYGAPPDLLNQLKVMATQ